MSGPIIANVIQATTAPTLINAPMYSKACRLLHANWSMVSEVANVSSSTKLNTSTKNASTRVQLLTLSGFNAFKASFSVIKQFKFFINS